MRLPVTMVFMQRDREPGLSPSGARRRVGLDPTLPQVLRETFAPALQFLPPVPKTRQIPGRFGFQADVHVGMSLVRVQNERKR